MNNSTTIAIINQLKEFFIFQPSISDLRERRASAKDLLRLSGQHFVSVRHQAEMHRDQRHSPRAAEGRSRL